MPDDRLVYRLDASGQYIAEKNPELYTEGEKEFVKSVKGISAWLRACKQALSVLGKHDLFERRVGRASKIYNSLPLAAKKAIREVDLEAKKAFVVIQLESKEQLSSITRSPDVVVIIKVKDRPDETWVG